MAGAHSLVRILLQLEGVNSLLAGTSKSKKSILGLAAGVDLLWNAFKQGAESIIEPTRALESSLVVVAKTADLTDAEVNKLRQDIMGMSEEIPLATKEFADIAGEVGRLGERGDDLTNLVQILGEFSLATDTSAKVAVRAMSKIKNAYSLTVDDVERLGNSVNELDNNFSTSSGNIIRDMQRVVTASDLGLAEKHLAAFVAAAQDAGLNVGEAGTSLERLFDNLVRNLDEIAAEMGIPAEALKKALNEDVAGALIGVFRKFNEMEDKLDSSARISELFGVRAKKAFVKLGRDTGQLTKALRISEQAFKDNNSIQKEVARTAETYDGRVQLLDNAVTNLKTSVGFELLPTLKEFVDDLTELVKGSDLADTSLDLLKRGTSGMASTLVSLAEAGLDAVNWMIDFGSNITERSGTIRFLITLLEGLWGMFGDPLMVVGSGLMELFRWIDLGLGKFGDFLGAITVMFPPIKKFGKLVGAFIIGMLAPVTVIFSAVGNVLKIFKEKLEGFVNFFGDNAIVKAFLKWSGASDELNEALEHQDRTMQRMEGTYERVDGKLRRVGDTARDTVQGTAGLKDEMDKAANSAAALSVNTNVLDESVESLKGTSKGMTSQMEKEKKAEEDLLGVRKKTVDQTLQLQRRLAELGTQRVDLARRIETAEQAIQRQFDLSAGAIDNYSVKEIKALMKSGDARKRRMGQMLKALRIDQQRLSSMDDEKEKIRGRIDLGKQEASATEANIKLNIARGHLLDTNTEKLVKASKAENVLIENLKAQTEVHKAQLSLRETQIESYTEIVTARYEQVARVAEAQSQAMMKTMETLGSSTVSVTGLMTEGWTDFVSAVKNPFQFGSSAIIAAFQRQAGLQERLINAQIALAREQAQTMRARRVMAASGRTPEWRVRVVNAREAWEQMIAEVVNDILIRAESEGFSPCGGS